MPRRNISSRPSLSDGALQDRELLLGSARLLAAFRLVRVDHPDGDQLAEVAARGRNLSASDLRDGFNHLIDRGVARRHGRCVNLAASSNWVALGRTPVAGLESG